VTVSLRARLFIPFALVVAIALAMLTILASQEQGRWIEARSRETLERSARLVVRDLAVRAPQGGWPAAASWAAASR